MGKSFRAYWGDGYSKTGSKVVGLNFFTNGQGYSDVNIAEVNRLEIGQILLLGGWNEKWRNNRWVVRSRDGSQEYHSVKRIK